VGYMELQKINCTFCGKLLTTASGEVEMPCRHCGKTVHVVTTKKGIIDLNKPVRCIENT